MIIEWNKMFPHALYTETVTIAPDDSRWVGAWWLGYLIAGTITLMSAVPFWFLPKSLPMPLDKHDTSCTPEQTRFIKDSPTMEHKFRPEEPANLHQMAKGLNIVSISFVLHWILSFGFVICMHSVESATRAGVSLTWLFPDCFLLWTCSCGVPLLSPWDRMHI